MKPISIGIEDYRIIKKDHYYVDKTLFLEDIISAPETSVFLYTRPRRYGKSLMLSMVDTFFNNAYRGEEYFTDTAIMEKHPEYVSLLNSVNVVHLNLKALNAASFSDFLYLLKEKMKEIYRISLEGRDLSSLPGDLTEYMEEFGHGDVDQGTLKLSLSKLTQILFYANHAKTLVLIDEYDSPFIDAKESGYYSEVKTFFKVFFGEALKGNRYLFKSILTGVIQISNTSVFSDLNNLIINNIFSNKTEYFGFNQGDVETLLRECGHLDEFGVTKEWYGGFVSQGEEIYNPWSILNLIRNGFAFKSYWVGTGSYSYIKEAIHCMTEKENPLFPIYQGEKAISSVKDSIDLEADERDNLIAMLLYSGYLTHQKTVLENQIIVSIPNKEIHSAFTSEIAERYLQSNGQMLTLYRLKEAFSKCDIPTIQSIMGEYILKSFSYYDLATEKVYQIIVTTMLSILFDDALVKSEVNEGMGRCDIFLRSKSNLDLAIVMEIKKLKDYKSEEILNASSLSALRQIRKKDYAEEAKTLKYHHIYAMGIAFAGKHVKVNGEIIESK